MNWSAIKPAIVAWVRAASGLDAEHVYWSQQDRPKTDGTRAVLSLRHVRTVGQDWLETEDAETPAPGAELTYRARGAREITVNVQVFPGTGPLAEAATPSQVLEAVVAAARLPSARDVLSAAGLGFAGAEDVLGLDGSLGFTVFEPRASVDVRLHAVSEVSESGTYIETVEVEPTVNEADEPPVWIPRPVAGSGGAAAGGAGMVPADGEVV